MRGPSSLPIKTPAALSIVTTRRGASARRLRPACPRRSARYLLLSGAFRPCLAVLALAMLALDLLALVLATPFPPLFLSAGFGGGGGGGGLTGPSPHPYRSNRPSLSPALSSRLPMSDQPHLSGWSLLRQILPLSILTIIGHFAGMACIAGLKLALLWVGSSELGG